LQASEWTLEVGSVEPQIASNIFFFSDYLLYGRLYLPTGRLDALYSLRISPNVQALVAAISDPPSSIPPDQQSRPDMSNIVINVQHDVGKWCTEYSWSAEDEMWGIKFLHNFGRLGSLSDIADEGGARRGLKRVDEEEPVEGGLKGRVSIGGELYFSAKEKSAGGECSEFYKHLVHQNIATVSTGIRFTTLPDAPSSLSQVPGSPSSSQYLSAHRSPPTTITALFNPMLGHISAAYTAKVSRDLALSSRFDFNVYSFESEWTMGAEWWLRRPPRVPTDDDIGRMAPSQNNSLPLPEVNGVVKARASTNNVRNSSFYKCCRDKFVQDVSLMWEGRLRNMLVSLGVVSDLSSRSKFIKALGLEIAFFSSE